MQERGSCQPGKTNDDVVFSHWMRLPPRSRLRKSYTRALGRVVNRRATAQAVQDEPPTRKIGRSKLQRNDLHNRVHFHAKCIVRVIKSAIREETMAKMGHSCP